MKLTHVFAVLSTLSSCIAAIPSIHSKPHEKRVVSHSPWVKRSRVPSHVTVPVRIGLTQSNLEAGDAMLMDISHPKSERFGQHLSAEEVDDLFAPSTEAVASVRSWLSSSTVGDNRISLSPNKQWLHFDASIAELEELLHTQYHEYHHETNEDASVGCDEYHLPKHIQKHIDYITPGVKPMKLKKRTNPDIEQKKTKRDTDNVASLKKNRPKITMVPETQIAAAQTNGSSGTPDCSFAITPECIRILYNVTDEVKAFPGNSLGVYETVYEIYNQSDLNAFFASLAPQVPAGTHPQFDPIDGAPAPSNATFAGGEADLDFQATYPLVYPDEVVLFQVDDYYYEYVAGNYTGLFNNFLDALDGSYCTYEAFNISGNTPGIDPEYPDTHNGGYNAPLQCGRYKPTNVISISYSLDEIEYSVNYQRRQCNEWMKLGLQGVSVVASTGDSGVAGKSETRTCSIFGPQNPINCPYVTAVGSTVLPPGNVAGQDPEIATTSFGSSGSFSNIFPRPDYQKDALDFFFDNYPPPYDYYEGTYNSTYGPGRYNRAGRGYPDVSATGQNLAGFISSYSTGAGSTLFAGTSVSAPVFAALITRINNFRLNAGKGPVGFLNPTFYAHPEVFNDITTGNNPGCGTDGFEAVPGWDPVTGLGTPNYGKLKELYLSLP